MNESFEELGRFWLPGNEESKISGILRFDPLEGIVLKTMDYFVNDEKIHDSSFFPKYNIIVGAIRGKKLTLCNCNLVNDSIAKYGIRERNYKADILFLGHFFNNINEFNFEKASIKFKYLEQWVLKLGFESKDIIDSEGHRNVSVNFKFPEDIEIYLDKFQLNITHSLKKEYNLFESNLKQNTLIEIIPNETMNFEDMKKTIIDRVQNFLSLGINAPVFPLTITMEIKDDKELMPHEVFCKPIEVYYPINNPLLNEKKSYFDLLFSFDSVSDNIGHVLKNWFKKYEVLKPVHDLFFAAIYNSYIYTDETLFLSLIQAVESYHRRIYNGKYLDSDDYKSVHKKITAAIPEQLEETHYNSLKSRIDFGNEFSLQSRLLELFNDFEDIFKLFIDDKDEFIKDLKNTRNYLTHYDKKMERKAKSGKELSLLSKKLNLIIKIFFLKELGINSDQIKEIVKFQLSEIY